MNKILLRLVVFPLILCQLYMSRIIRFVFLVSAANASGSKFSVQVVPVDANADAFHVSAITNEVIVSPDSVSPWIPAVVGDIEAQLPTREEEPIVYMIPGGVGTPSPHENHELDREQIVASERRFYSIAMFALLCFVLLACLIAKLSI